MASFTLTSVADLFGVGTSVSAYRPAGNTEAPVYGPAVSTAPVQADGTLTFSGLDYDLVYVAYDGARTKWFRTRRKVSDSGIVIGEGDPSGVDLEGEYWDDRPLPTGKQMWVFGNKVDLIRDQPSLPPFPLLNNQPIFPQVGSFALSDELAGYRIEVTGADPVVTLSSVPSPGDPFEIVFMGTGVLTFVKGSDVTTTPVLPLVMLPAGSCRVVYSAVGQVGLTGSGLIGVPAAPRNGIAPSISCADPRVGATVTLDHPGGWDGNPDSKVVQWLRGATPIGAGADTYVLVTADANTAITASVTTTNWRGTSAAKVSNVINALPAAAAIPTVNVAPVLSGSAVTGSTLSVTDGTYNNNPTGVTKQWQRDIGAGFVNIGGATANTYGPLAGGDVGFPLRCIVTATNSAGSVSTTVGPVTPTSAATSLATVVPYDMASYVYGHSNRVKTPDMAEAPPKAGSGRYQGDWSFQPTPNSSLDSTQGGTNPRIQAWAALYQVQGGNPAQTRVEQRDLQTWIEFLNGDWIRGDYSEGGSGDLFPEDWIFNGGVTAGGGSKTAIKASVGGSTLVHLGANPPPGVTRNPENYIYHSWCPNGYDARTGTGTHDKANIKRILVACRARLEPATYSASAKYMLYMAADKKGPAWENGWDVVIGRGKTVDQTWRVYTGTVADAQPLSTAGPYPPNGLTGVLSAAEYR